MVHATIAMGAADPRGGGTLFAEKQVKKISRRSSMTARKSTLLTFVIACLVFSLAPLLSLQATDLSDYSNPRETLRRCYQEMENLRQRSRQCAPLLSSIAQWDRYTRDYEYLINQKETQEAHLATTMAWMEREKNRIWGELQAADRECKASWTYSKACEERDRLDKEWRNAASVHAQETTERQGLQEIVRDYTQRVNAYKRLIAENERKLTPLRPCPTESDIKDKAMECEIYYLNASTESRTKPPRPGTQTQTAPGAIEKMEISGPPKANVRQKVQFTAYFSSVENRSAPGPFGYTWYLDGKVIGKSSSGNTQVVDVPSATGRHTVAVRGYKWVNRTWQPIGEGSAPLEAADDSTGRSYTGR
jgi:hypothetical protein